MHDHVKKVIYKYQLSLRKFRQLQLMNGLKKIKKFNVGEFKSKFNRLHKKHREFSNLIARIRFGWVPISIMVTTFEAF